MKKKETYASLASKYNVPEQELIQTAGITKLTAGQIIPLPPQRTSPIHDVPTSKAPQLPNLPGYGETVKDIRAKGAVVTGQKDIAGYEAFKQQERQSANDEAIRTAYENLNFKDRGPQARWVRDRYVERFGRDQTPVGKLLETAAGRREDANAKIKTMTPEELAQQRDATEGSTVNPWEQFMFYLGGSGKTFDEKTGKYTEETAGPGQTQADFLRGQAQTRRMEEMIAYYEEVAVANAPKVDAQGKTITPQIAPDYGEQYAIENYPKTDSIKNYSDGENVFYNGRIIPQNEFLEFLDAQENAEFKNLDEYLNSEQGQRETFLNGSRDTLQAVSSAIQFDDRGMLPLTITPAQLALMGSDRDWDDYMSNVLNYRWDSEKGAWIRQDDDLAYPIGGLGGGGYGGGWGGYGSGGDWKPGSGQVEQIGTGKAARADIRFAQNVGGMAEIHWRV